MGFLNGRAQFARFKVQGRSAKHFTQEHLDKLARHAIGTARVLAGDGVDVGWTAAGHLLDVRFDLAKNILGDCLFFACRIDQQTTPGDLLRAYTQVELEGMGPNPSGRQRREARMAARDRIEQEARDGRYLKRKAFEILWDGPSSEVLVASTSLAAVDRLLTLFQQTFHHGFQLQNAGRRAYDLAELRQQTRNVDDASPTVFVQGGSSEPPAWSPDENGRDFLGNEFLLWLWFVLETESDTIKLLDESEISVMLARNLVLECPRGETGRESITSDAPTRLPEARRAIQSGKLPRKAGMTLVRHERTYELTLHAESLAATGIKFPACEEEEEHARVLERVVLLRHLTESLDMLYDAFGRRRLGSDWPKELAKMKKWLTAGE